MPNVHIVTADPLGLGTKDATAGINLTDLQGGPSSTFLEVMAGNGQWITSAVKALKPIEQWSISYELLSGAALTLVFGVPVNTNYLIIGAQFGTNADGYPTVQLSVVKPSAANLIKSYANTVEVELVGGFGVVNKLGATSTDSFISSGGSVSMQQLEAMNETSGDFLVGGLYTYGFKLEAQQEAYAAITNPVGSFVTDAPIRESRDGWQIYAKNWWKYLDALTEGP